MMVMMGGSDDDGGDVSGVILFTSSATTKYGAISRMCSIDAHLKIPIESSCYIIRMKPNIQRACTIDCIPKKA